MVACTECKHYNRNNKQTKKKTRRNFEAETPLGKPGRKVRRFLRWIFGIF
jgi:hypothetical protein